MSKTCLIRTFLRENALESVIGIFKDSGYLVRYIDPETQDRFSAEDLENAEVIIGNLNLYILKKCKNLKWLQVSSSGADAFAKSGVLDRDKTVLTNATGAYGHAIAEYMVAGVLSLTKKFNLYRDDQFSGRWVDHGFVKTINGSKVLIVGFGDIGSQFGEKMHALGARITGIKRTPSEKPDFVNDIYTLDKLNELLPSADVVALCLPNTRQTTNIMGEEQFKLMKDDAILINVGRGSAIDTDALTKALHNRVIAGAVLDVTEPEPLPADHPLWQEKNAVITPHISGGYHSIEIVESIEKIIIENCRRYVNGQDLINIVDYDTGYRKN